MNRHVKATRVMECDGELSLVFTYIDGKESTLRIEDDSYLVIEYVGRIGKYPIRNCIVRAMKDIQSVEVTQSAIKSLMLEVAVNTAQLFIEEDGLLEDTSKLISSMLDYVSSESYIEQVVEGFVEFLGKALVPLSVGAFSSSYLLEAFKYSATELEEVEHSLENTLHLKTVTSKDLKLLTDIKKLTDIEQIQIVCDDEIIFIRIWSNNAYTESDAVSIYLAGNNKYNKVLVIGMLSEALIKMSINHPDTNVAGVLYNNELLSTGVIREYLVFDNISTALGFSSAKNIPVYLMITERIEQLIRGHIKRARIDQIGRTNNFLR